MTPLAAYRRLLLRPIIRPLGSAGLLILCCSIASADETPQQPGEPPTQLFRAGAYAIDVTPAQLPVIVNGSMRENTADRIVDRLHARCLVLDDSREPLAIVVVDSCMMPRSLLDEAKQLAAQATGIRPERMLISATHTHSAPSVMPVLGSRRDEAYTALLPRQIAKGIQLAADRLAPARIGWAIGRDEVNVACRRWLMKPGSLGPNPFGQPGERAQMHPGFDNPNAVRPTGPVDPEVAVLSVQTAAGQPLALVANYSMHYVGGPAVSADYFGMFCEEIAQLIAPAPGPEPFVAMLSNGTSGDAWCLDYALPKRKIDRRSVARDVAAAAHQAYKTIEYHAWVPLVMEERLLELPVRMPTEEEAAAARELLERARQVDETEIPLLPRIYAGETLALRDMPATRELKLQAIRIGALGIAAIPNEVFASTGLAIKGRSPLTTTFNISLANGAEGYIPPPEQHALGGYTTWRARSSCLDVEAEPKITEAVLELLDEVAKTPTPPEPEPQSRRLPGQRTPRESLAAMHLHEQFRIELVAAEPQVVDPVAYDWGPDGTLWVVEMADYPLGIDGQGEPGGRIRRLHDPDGDGVYDQSSLFAAGLPFPNGISVWRNGVIVTAAPHILYLEDSDGDGQADVERPLYTGVSEGNPQLRLNGLRWGLDGWLYCGNGMSSTGEIVSLQTGAKLNVRGRDLRIRPDTGDLDPQLGVSQFGRHRDDWGNWFGVSNNRPIWQFLLADQYLRRNRHVVPPDCQSDLGRTEASRTVYPRSAPGVFFHPSEVGRFTSANSTVFYRDELFGPEFDGCWFVSEPTHNLIHRGITAPQGAALISRRAPEEQTSEFLAAEDTWFRPNMLRTGPDGALWVADMAREIIDHPQYIPEDQHARLNFRNGEQQGRIYRILPKQGVPRPIPRLIDLDDSSLAALLDSPNGTLRDMVQKQIAWQRRTGAVATLEQVATESGHAAARLQALWTLEGLGSLEPALVTAALNDPHPGVRRGGVRLAEGKLDHDQQLANAVFKKIDDPDAQVRLQLACTLGESRDPRVSTALAQLALRDGDDPIVAAAVLSSLRPDNVGPVLAHLLAVDEARPAALLGNCIVTAIGYGQLDAALGHIEGVTTPHAIGAYAPWQIEALQTLCEGLRRQRHSLAELVPRHHAASDRLDAMFATLRRTVADREAPHAARLAAVRLLAEPLGAGADDGPLLARLLDPRESAALQMAAVDALAQRNLPDAATWLLAGWKSYSPPVRDAVLDALLGRESWTLSLLDAIEQDALSLNELDATDRNRLAQHQQAAVRERTAQLSAGLHDPDRRQVVLEWQSALELAPDVAHGKLVFAKRCATCHRLAGEGHAVGPDLAALTDKSPRGLFVSILDPGRAIDARYLNYAAVTDEGRAYAGILTSESEASITLLGPDGQTHVLLRDALQELQSTGKSMMPDGLEKDVTPQELADVIAYVASQ